MGSMDCEYGLRVHRAIQFAAMAHAGQVRKGTDIPYIVHPFEVAQILTAEGAAEDLVIAGLLHDTLEDTNTTQEDILCAFGGSVLGLVKSASEDKSLSWEARKRHTVLFLSDTATFEQALLALADKLSNLRSIAADYMKQGDALWSRFNRGYTEQRWYYTALLDAFEALSDTAAYAQFSKLIENVFQV